MKDDLNRVQPGYVKQIFKIPGVKAVWLYPYSVNIERGRVFSWKKMAPKILKAIKSRFSPSNKMVEVVRKRVKVEPMEPQHRQAMIDLVKHEHEPITSDRIAGPGLGPRKRKQ